MRTKFIGAAALVTLIFTALWLILLIWEQATVGPLETVDQAVTYLSGRGWRYTFTYLNAAAVTLTATALMALLYLYVRPAAPEWALVGFVFLPVYCALNLAAYLSQITLVPALVEAINGSAADPAALRLLLAQSLQMWPGSAVGFFNGLAYAVLAVPSLIYGLLLPRGSGLMKSAGWLLALNGAACLLGLLGYLAGSALLSTGILAGGFLFFLALIPLSGALWRPPPGLAGTAKG